CLLYCALCLYLVRCPPISPLFPYTTLFRSLYGSGALREYGAFVADRDGLIHVMGDEKDRLFHPAAQTPQLDLHFHPQLRIERGRSEEHTSELQSRENLVCRLLLEKKKNTKK